MLFIGQFTPLGSRAATRSRLAIACRTTVESAIDELMLGHCRVAVGPE
jgi:hypothetical protein